MYIFAYEIINLRILQSGEYATVISRYWCRQETGIKNFEKGIGNIVLKYAGIRNEFPKKEIKSVGLPDWWFSDSWDS